MSKSDRLLPADWVPPSEHRAPPPEPPVVLAHGHHTPHHVEIYRGIRAILDNLEALARRIDAHQAESGHTAP